MRAVAVACVVAAGSALAVNPDYAPHVPCWRDLTGTTRQVWTFDSNANPHVPSVKVNQPGNPTVALTVGSLGHGWYNTTCAEGLGGCGATALALIPLTKNCFSNTKWRNSANTCIATFTDPPTLGTAQGYWDMGGAGAKLVLTIPNNGAPAGTIRYFSVQGTYLVASSVADVPFSFLVTNNAGAFNDFNDPNYIADSVLVEQPLDASSKLSPNAWNNEVFQFTNAAATAAGSDTIVIDAQGNPFWVDSLVVETFDRACNGDSLNAQKNTVTNIPYASLLANDRGGSLTAVGGAVNGTVATNAGNVVTFTPNNNYTGAASFWYTNVDCLGNVLSAQVSLNVQAVNHAPVAGNDSYSRASGVSLKIKISDLLTNDTDADFDTLTVTNITLVSTNGANVYSNGNLLVYTNSATVDALDQISYVITDGQGGSATGRVSIAVVPGVSGQATGTLTVSGGQVTVTFHGIPGANYVVERSTNGTTWRKLVTNTANPVGTAPVGQVGYTDTFSDLLPTPGVPSSAMYRLTVP
jgi:hypothetical protein